MNSEINRRKFLGATGRTDLLKGNYSAAQKTFPHSWVHHWTQPQNITLINRLGIAGITSSATFSTSPPGSFARVLSLQAGVDTIVSITI